MRFNNLCSIDVGLTKVRLLAFVDDKPHKQTFPVAYNFTREKLLKIIHDFYLSLNRKFDGLAISLSGYASDMVVKYTNLTALNDLCTVDFNDLGCEKVCLISRSKAAVLAGKLDYPNSKVLVGVSFNPCIEFGVLIQNELFIGSNGYAGGYYFDHKTTPGEVLTNIINFYNPDVVYFVDNDNNLINLFRYCNRHLPAVMTTHVKFVKTIYEDYACCFGAMQYLSEQIGKP